jgi:hypothetical protein
MKALKILALLLVVALVAIVAPAEKKPKKSDVPEVVATGHTVAVISRDGGAHDMLVSDEERVAIAAVRDELKAWGRYTVVADLGQADIVLVVHKGKAQQETSGRGRAQGGSGNSSMDLDSGGDAAGRMAQATRSGLGVEMDVTADTLAVCARDAKGRVGNPLWSRTMDGGLDGVSPMLMNQLRLAVDRAFPPAAPQP